MPRCSASAKALSPGRTRTSGRAATAATATPNATVLTAIPRATAERDQARGSNRGDSWRNDGRRGDNDRWDGNRWSGNDSSRWNRQWRRDHRYNWQGYRNSHRDVYRLGRYYAPYRNYSYRRLGVGIFLDSLFFGSRYWIDDPWYYHLPPAYGSYRWIRYYDDALLVDIYSGEVIDVIYDFFW